MNRIYIRSEFKTPHINFDPEKGLIEMKGKSIPEHAKAFYSNLIEWIKEYSLNPQTITTVNLMLEYVNTDTKKYLLEIVELFGKLQKDGKKIIVKDELLDHIDNNINKMVENIFEKSSSNLLDNKIIDKLIDKLTEEKNKDKWDE